MSHYYHIETGNRYDASLIANARFRTRGRDHFISRADAQQLWRIAMDGGRITEIEEQTIQYLFERFNWTEAARKWMEEELKKGVQKASSYYKVIDGLRYDRAILDKAESLTEGKGDGRISKENAEFLLPLFSDFGDITIEEERTFHFLLEHFKWTDPARALFLQHFEPISKESDVRDQITAIMRFEFGFSRYPFGYIRAELLDQMLHFRNEISFPDALRQALTNLLEYEGEGSFRSLFGGYTGEQGPGLRERMIEFLEDGRLALLPGKMASEPSLPRFPDPWKGESFEFNWIFGLELFDLTDDIYWVIVSRIGKRAAYNYVGGPNVETEWPRA